MDQRRLAGELALRTVLATQELVCRLIAWSIKDGQTWSAELRHHRVSVVVPAADSEAYLALGAEGFLDERVLGIVLASVPGIAPEDWLPEPDGAMGIQPKFGELLYSAVLPIETQARIVERFADEEYS